MKPLHEGITVYFGAFLFCVFFAAEILPLFIYPLSI